MRLLSGLEDEQKSSVISVYFILTVSLRHCRLNVLYFSTGSAETLKTDIEYGVTGVNELNFPTDLFQ